MNSKFWLTGVFLLLVPATLAACGGGGGGAGSTAAPPPDNAPHFTSVAYVANGDSDNVSAYTIDAMTGALTEIAGSPFAAGIIPLFVTTARRIQ